MLCHAKTAGELKPAELFEALDAHATSHAHMKVQRATLEARLRAALSLAETCCADFEGEVDNQGPSPAELTAGPDHCGGSTAELPPLKDLQRACELLAQGKGNVDPRLLLQRKLYQLEQHFESAGVPVAAPWHVLQLSSRNARVGTPNDFECEGAAVAALHEFCETHLFHEPASVQPLGSSGESGCANSVGLRLCKRRCFDLQIRLRLGLAALRVQRCGGGDPVPEKDYKMLKKFVQLLGVQLSMQSAQLPLPHAGSTTVEMVGLHQRGHDIAGKNGGGGNSSGGCSRRFSSAQEYVMMLRKCFGDLLPKTTARLARDFEVKINELAHVNGAALLRCRNESPAATPNAMEAPGAATASVPSHVVAKLAAVSTVAYIQLASAAPELDALVSRDANQLISAPATKASAEAMTAVEQMRFAACGVSSQCERACGSEESHQASHGRDLVLGEVPRMQRQRSIGHQLKKQKEKRLENEREKQLAHQEQSRRQKLVRQVGGARHERVGNEENGALDKTRVLLLRGPRSMTHQGPGRSRQASELHGLTCQRMLKEEWDKRETNESDDSEDGGRNEDKQSTVLVCFDEVGGRGKAGIEQDAVSMPSGERSDTCGQNDGNVIDSNCTLGLHSKSSDTGGQAHDSNQWVPLARATPEGFQAPLAAAYKKKKREYEAARVAEREMYQDAQRHRANHAKGTVASVTLARSTSQGGRGERLRLCSPGRESTHVARGGMAGTSGEAGVNATYCQRKVVSASSPGGNTSQGMLILMSPALQPTGPARIFVEETPDRDGDSQLTRRHKIVAAPRIAETPSQPNGVATSGN